MRSGIQIPSSTVHRWPESFYLFPKGDPYLLQLRAKISEKSNPKISSCNWLNYNTRVSSIKVRTLIGMEWDRESWNRIYWETLMKWKHWALNSDESSLPGETAFPPMVEVASLPSLKGLTPDCLRRRNGLPWGSHHAKQCWFSSRYTPATFLFFWT